MTDKQPEALRLADLLQSGSISGSGMGMVADSLRAQHAAIKELREALRSVSAALARQRFGDCRLFSAPGEPLLTPAEAEQKSRAALANTEDA